MNFGYAIAAAGQHMLNKPTITFAAILVMGLALLARRLALFTYTSRTRAHLAEVPVFGYARRARSSLGFSAASGGRRARPIEIAAHSRSARPGAPL
jgi:hypothetical protein